VSFEYEITITKPHPEIQIIAPLQGEITGNLTTYLDFSYQPMSFATAEAEISIRTTEFDSEPRLVRIVGNAAPYSGPPVQQKTLLTTAKSYNPTIRLSKLNKTDAEEEGST